MGCRRAETRIGMKERWNGIGVPIFYLRYQVGSVRRRVES